MNAVDERPPGLRMAETFADRLDKLIELVLYDDPDGLGIDDDRVHRIDGVTIVREQICGMVREQTLKLAAEAWSAQENAYGHVRQAERNPVSRWLYERAEASR
jgi:hypothetical protein